MARKRKGAKGGVGAQPSAPDANGGDATLIRWMLSLTPAQRLRACQDFAEAVNKLRASRIKT